MTVMDCHQTFVYVPRRNGFFARSKHHLAAVIELFPRLNVEDDAPHAFYLGLELARAEIALNLGKRYEQDEVLSWGCVLPQVTPDLEQFSEEKSTLKARKHNRRAKKAQA